MPERRVPYLRRNIGMVFQDFRLLDERTAFDNVAFAMQVIGATMPEIARRVPAVLEMVGLGDKIDAASAISPVVNSSGSGWPGRSPTGRL